MTVMRIRSNLKKCAFGYTSSSTKEVFDKNNNRFLVRQNIYNPLGEADIDSDFSKIDFLKKEEQVKFKKHLDSQMLEIKQSFARNAEKGIFGGRPVIKSNSKDDNKYKNHAGYIPGRKVGEFIGVIADTYDLGYVDIKQEQDSKKPSMFADIMSHPEDLQIIMEPFFDEVMAYAVTKTSAPKDALSQDQCKEILKLSQQLRDLILKGFSWPLSDFSEELKSEMENWIKELKSKDNGVIWGKTKKIPVLLSESKN